ncbi:integrase core domain-containing protein [Roseovarius sp. MBR-6]|uniref:integrase core domain-containing protein n=1 Tax=Roseovarius sp. MBR-6 TaxID=3156459 RepID=UPI0033974BA1
MNQCWFTSIFEARQIIEEWRIDYNTERPHEPLEISNAGGVRSRALDWLSTSLPKGISREGDRVIFWTALVIISSPRRMSEATLPISPPVTLKPTVLSLPFVPAPGEIVHSCELWQMNGRGDRSSQL